jgi:hypothetical protein
MMKSYGYDEELYALLISGEKGESYACSFPEIASSNPVIQKARSPSRESSAY